MSGSIINKIQPLQITIVKKLRDYSKDPYFVKKAEEAKAFIKKHGIPEDFKKKK